MLAAHEIRSRAAQASVDPGIVEKDYVLSKVLIALAPSAAFQERFRFKGGTALKKCFYPHWRFSEDLDFTITDSVPVKEIQALFQEAVDKVKELFGFSMRVLEFSQYPKTASPVSVQLKLGYDGPLRKGSGQKNNIRVDLAFDEQIVLEPISRPLLPMYPDDTTVALPVYPLEEIVAEKLRSILQRGKSRDYYDVWLLLKDHTSDFSLGVTQRVLREKCRHRGIPSPTVEMFLQPERVVEAQKFWERGLAHQVSALPALGHVVTDLQRLLTQVVG